MVRQVLSGAGFVVAGLATAYLVFAVAMKALVSGFWSEFARVSLVCAGAIVLGVMLIRVGRKRPR